MTHSKASLSKSYCVLPFIQQFVDTDKRILPCCIADRSRLGPEYKGTESFNSDYLKRIRYKMLTGGKTPDRSHVKKTTLSGSSPSLAGTAPSIKSLG